MLRRRPLWDTPREPELSMLAWKGSSFVVSSEHSAPLRRGWDMDGDEGWGLAPRCTPQLSSAVCPYVILFVLTRSTEQFSCHIYKRNSLSFSGGATFFFTPRRKKKRDDKNVQWSTMQAMPCFYAITINSKLSYVFFRSWSLKRQ